MSDDKPWYDDLRAIGNQLKAGYTEDLVGNTGQALKAFSPQGSGVYQKGLELVDEAANTAKENASDYEGRGIIAKPLIHAARFLSKFIAPFAVTTPLMVSPLAQAAALGLLGGGSEGQKAYEKVRSNPDMGEGRAMVAGSLNGLSGGIFGALSTPVTFAEGGFRHITPAGSAEVTRSAGRAVERRFARFINESGLATKKYDKFIANKADPIDRIKTVSGQGMPALPANVKSKADAVHISKLQDLLRRAGASEQEIEQEIQEYWARRMI